MCHFYKTKNEILIFAHARSFSSGVGREASLTDQAFLLAVLYFSFVPYFSASSDFPSPPLSAPGSPRMGERRF